MVLFLDMWQIKIEARRKGHSPSKILYSIHVGRDDSYGGWPRMTHTRMACVTPHFFQQQKPLLTLECKRCWPRLAPGRDGPQTRAAFFQSNRLKIPNSKILSGSFHSGEGEGLLIRWRFETEHIIIPGRTPVLWQMVLILRSSAKHVRGQVMTFRSNHSILQYIQI